MKTSSAKAKGRRAQQLVRDAILATFPDLTEDDVRSTAMGSNGVDIQLSTAAKERFPYSVEVKARARGFAVVYDALEQSKPVPGMTNIAVLKGDRKNPVVVLDLSDFLALVSAAQSNPSETFPAAPPA